MKGLLTMMLAALLLAAVATGCETRTGASDEGKQEEAVSRDGSGAAGTGGSGYTAPAPTGAAAETGYQPSGGVGSVAPGRE